MSTSPLYYQGQRVDGLVSASSATTFREVVEKFRVPPQLAIRHADFLALDQKRRDELKQVPYFVPCCFKSSPSQRLYTEATHCNLIFLDIDPEKEKRDGKWVETGRYPAAPFIRDISLLHTALRGYNFAAHLTASSTPEKPRMRIVVGADHIPVARYREAVEMVAGMLGLPVITKESMVAVQPMFLPVLFSDSTDDDQPLLTHEDGEDLRLDDISTTEPVNGSNGKSHVSAPRTPETVSIDALEFLRAPVEEISLPIVKEALDTIDADCSRPEWLNCAAALKHQFAHSKEDEAYELFDTWSSTGQKYGGAEETRKIWNSLRPTPIGRLPITIRSLFHAAEAAGWDGKKVKEDTFKKLIRWVEEVDSVSSLMEDGPRKIVAAPMLSAVHEDILINHIAANVKKRFAYPVSPTAIRKDVARYRQEVKVREQAAAPKPEPDWAKGVLYIAQTREFFRQRTGERFKPEAFDALYGRKLLPSPDELRAAGLPITPKTLSTPLVSPSDYALNHLKIPTVYDYAYDPSNPTEVWLVAGGRKYVNTYCPTYPDLAPENRERAGELFQGHLRNLIREDEYRQKLVDFMAYIVQFPGLKIRWAPFIQSAEGAGKTFLANVMRGVLGKGHVRTIGDETIKKGWTEWSFGRQLVVLEEVYASGASRHAVMNTLKKLITNDDIPIEQRNRDSREVENTTNYLLFSNHHDALAITPNDRRYFIVKSPLQSKSQVLELGEDYFTRLFSFLETHPGAFRSYLMDWPISPDFNPNGHAPRTKYLQEMVSDSSSDLVFSVRKLLLEGDHPLIQFDIVSAKAILDVIQLEEGLHPVSPQQLGHVLREEGFRQIGRHLYGQDRHYIWCRNGVDEQKAPLIAAERFKNNSRHLCMELVCD
jgi:hypothetical protein